MTDPVESLARALTVYTWQQGWDGLTPDAQVIALAETRHALERAARDITEAIARDVEAAFGPVLPTCPCADCEAGRRALDAIRGWRP